MPGPFFVPAILFVWVSERMDEPSLYQPRTSYQIYPVQQGGAG